jgi:hypothetical protein
MTAISEKGSKVFELRTEEPRGAETATKKVNVFAEWDVSLVAWPALFF